MKKVIILLILMIIGFLLILNFSINDKKQEQETGKQISENKLPGTILLKFGLDMPENTAQYIAALKFADIVNYKTNGKVQIKIYPNQQLGTDQEMIQMARSGELAIILPPTSKMTTLIPEMKLLDLPFLFSNREDIYEILDGKIGNILLEKFKPYGLIGVTFWERGFKQFTANKKIQTPKDFENLNIRTMKSQVIMDQFKAFGANPIPIDFKTTYQALKDKAVDGQENSLSAIVGMDFYKVQPHLTISNHAYLACPEREELATRSAFKPIIT